MERHYLNVNDTRVRYFTQLQSTVVNGIEIRTSEKYKVNWTDSFEKPFGYRNGKVYVVDKLYQEADAERFVKFKGFVHAIPLTALAFEAITK